MRFGNCRKIRVDTLVAKMRLVSNDASILHVLQTSFLSELDLLPDNYKPKLFMINDNNMPAMLNVEPKNDIVVEGPFNRLVKKSIVIDNPGEVLNVGFRLKTTTPDIFFVRPSSGVLGPGEKVTVDFYLKPIGKEVGQYCFTFFIQAAVVVGGNIDLEEVWKRQNSIIWEARIKFKLIPPKSPGDYACPACIIGTGFENREDDQEMAARRKPIMTGYFPLCMMLSLIGFIVGAFYGVHFL